MSEQEPLGTSALICEIVGCTNHSTTTRWIMTEKDEKRRIEVCWEHLQGDFDVQDAD